jgi:Ulp1 family protease
MVTVICLLYRKVNIFEKEKLIVPINYPFRTHWLLAVIDFKRKKVRIRDSIRDAERQGLVYKALTNFLCDEVSKNPLCLAFKESFNIHDWNIDIPVTNPLQSNNYDCGMFLLKNIEHEISGETLHFTKKDADDFRFYMANYIMKQYEKRV